MLKLLNSFFVKIKQVLEPKPIDYFNLYLKRVNTFTWSNYKSLNKYEKIYAFSMEGIEDIEIIDAVREAYFNSDNPYTKGILDKSIKAKIKALNIYLKDIPLLITNNNTILHNLMEHLTGKDLILSTYIRIVSPLVGNPSDIEVNLHGFIFHKNDDRYNNIFPPNYPNDKSHILFIRKSQLKKYGIENLDMQNINFKLHKDYDFNICEYIIKDLDTSLN
ncbi:MAG: hypothetical protein NTW78_05840 [Campylobacterales bacterium]|nr:hypothetical protein [Campylobacterales bacterium]